ncbi:MAG: hypothetical protein ACR2LA_11345 [Acidimicrobiales bacterium]
MTAAVDLVKRTCAAQNLPEQVTDVAVLARVAALLGPARDSTPGTESEGTAKTVSAGQARGGRCEPA